MQRSRRRDPIPWTWEIPLAVTALVVLLLVLAAQLGRTFANLTAGAGWRWAPREQLFTSLPGLARGDATAGLTHLTHPAGPHLLWTGIGLAEVAALAAAAWAGKAAWDRWGPSRLRGMATRTDAETMLGRARLRAAAPIIRPDRYGPRRPR